MQPPEGNRWDNYVDFDLNDDLRPRRRGYLQTATSMARGTVALGQRAWQSASLPVKVVSGVTGAAATYGNWGRKMGLPYSDWAPKPKIDEDDAANVARRVLNESLGNFTFANNTNTTTFKMNETQVADVARKVVNESLSKGDKKAIQVQSVAQPIPAPQPVPAPQPTPAPRVIASGYGYSVPRANNTPWALLGLVGILLALAQRR